MVNKCSTSTQPHNALLDHQKKAAKQHPWMPVILTLSTYRACLNGTNLLVANLTKFICTPYQEKMTTVKWELLRTYNKMSLWHSSQRRCFWRLLMLRRTLLWSKFWSRMTFLIRCSHQDLLYLLLSFSLRIDRILTLNGETTMQPFLETGLHKSSSFLTKRWNGLRAAIWLNMLKLSNKNLSMTTI